MSVVNRVAHLKKWLLPSIWCQCIGCDPKTRDNDWSPPKRGGGNARRCCLSTQCIGSAPNA